jgi:hypothetical protein
MENNELTKFQLLAMENRVEEINALLDSVVELDDDICDNLIAELDEMETKILRSLKTIRIKESGLRIV